MSLRKVRIDTRHLILREQCSYISSKKRSRSVRSFRIFLYNATFKGSPRSTDYCTEFHLPLTD